MVKKCTADKDKEKWSMLVSDRAHLVQFHKEEEAEPMVSSLEARERKPSHSAQTLLQFQLANTKALIDMYSKLKHSRTNGHFQINWHLPLGVYPNIPPPPKKKN